MLTYLGPRPPQRARNLANLRRWDTPRRATIELLDVDTDTEFSYRIVGEDEASIKTGLISYTSPIARALIGKAEGDEVSFQAPGGEKNFEILTVKYI